MPFNPQENSELSLMCVIKKCWCFLRIYHHRATWFSLLSKALHYWKKMYWKLTFEWSPAWLLMKYKAWHCWFYQQISPVTNGPLRSWVTAMNEDTAKSMSQAAYTASNEDCGNLKYLELGNWWVLKDRRPNRFTQGTMMQPPCSWLLALLPSTG